VSFREEPKHPFDVPIERSHHSDARHHGRAVELNDQEQQSFDRVVDMHHHLARARDNVQLSEVRNTRRPASSNRREQCALHQEQCQLQEWQFDCAPIGAAGSRHADCAARTD
jgi:hypothetical protein